MPADVRRGIYELSLGAMQYYVPLEPGEQVEHNPLFLGQALYFALDESNRRMREDPNFSGRFSIERMQRISTWVRDTMDLCQRENIFRELFSYYFHSLAENTTEDIHRYLGERLEPRILRSMEQTLATFRGQLSIAANSPEEMVLLGSLLGQHQQDTSLGILRYALANGLIQSRELERIPLEASSLEDFRSRSERMGILDVGTLTKGQVRILLRRHHVFDDLVRESVLDYGEGHPLVQGWMGGFFGGVETGSRRDRIDQVVQTVETYLEERH